MIETVKSEIKNHLNQEVKIVARENRSKTEVFYGYIIEYYNHVFVVSNGETRKSYSYNDILSKDILISFL